MKREIRFAHEIMRRREWYHNEERCNMAQKAMTAESLRSKAEAVGIDWTVLQNLWTKFGPTLISALIFFLQSASSMKSKGGMKAESVKCGPDCLANLDKAIEDLTAGLVGTIAHRECCCCE